MKTTLQNSHLGRKSRTGFMFIDALVGLGIAGVVMVALTVAISHHERAARVLSETRAAARAAETALSELQAGRAPPAVEEGTQVTVRPAPGASPPAGYRWVEVEAFSNGHSVTLVGLAPEAQSKGGAP